MRLGNDVAPRMRGKRTLLFLAAACTASLITGVSANLALSRPDGASQGPPSGAADTDQRPKKPRPPLEQVLDANGDGVIDADEIAKAPAALKKLDKNGDGKLTPDEYRPPRPAEGAGPQQGRAGQEGPR